MRPVSSGQPLPTNLAEADIEAPPAPDRDTPSASHVQTPSPNIEPNNMPFQGVYGRVAPHALTRAEVHAEAVRANKAGEIPRGEQPYPMPQASSVPGKSREQVIAELAEAKAAGQVTYGEQEYPAPTVSSAPSKTREQVRAELSEAKAAGLVTYGEQEYPATPMRPAQNKPGEPTREWSLIDKLRDTLKTLWGRGK
ncbi:DUF4148 domain-containing protein [Bordetella genomosp. 4]|uniref:DUF4148 domain-containing protein n=1 Tax=Bordetella genomosp. 4 TaxID=463044 RepID=UPI0020CEE15D|nr:DUF4148 domain-containing protein [Bordetella genomosp. 4]